MFSFQTHFQRSSHTLGGTAQIGFPVGQGVKISVRVSTPAGAEVVGVGSGGTNSGSGEDVTRGDAIGTLLIRGGDVGVGKK